MKLQKQLSRRVGNKEYPKWVIAVPPKQIATLGWNGGEFLESEVMDQKLIVKKENMRRVEKRREAAKET